MCNYNEINSNKDNNGCLVDMFKKKRMVDHINKKR